ncbi:MAG: NifU family protein [Chloroflexi bacterium]|nr:MAG: NifU family protein [Chloroflexota bacterium]
MARCWSGGIRRRWASLAEADGVPLATERVAELEARLAQVEALPDAGAREVAVDAIQGLLGVYGAGLARILELAPELAPRLGEDELVSHLLLLHGLHPVDARTRVEGALESVRPYLASHGGNVELLSVANGVAYLRLEGTCHGCPSSTATLKHAIEQAIFKVAPDVERIEADGVAVGPQVISIDSLVCPLP